MGNVHIRCPYTYAHYVLYIYTIHYTYSEFHCVRSLSVGGWSGTKVNQQDIQQLSGVIGHRNRILIAIQIQLNLVFA